MPSFFCNSIAILPIQTGPPFKSSTKPSIFLHPNSAATRIRAATPPTSAPTAASDPHLWEPSRRRPMCAVCTKPLRVCLCGHLRGPPLDTAVGVTVLQHPAEAQHPLSSVRAARLGLRNLAVAQVADVSHRASFLLTTNLGDGAGEAETVEVGAAAAATGEAWTVETMDKCSIAYTEKALRIDIERGVGAIPETRWPASRGSSLDKLAVSNGFTVTKTQESGKPTRSTTGEEASPEFSIAIPPHSALLFPCQRATAIDAASDCQVVIKHLIVLDGTWAKAHRMYHENPWLQLVPHVKVEPERVSLYGEVRHEPRAGCLSTIESIVAAMKELGEDEAGLDRVLAVFESMVSDQRRCKDEN